MHIAVDAIGISRPGGGRSATLNLLGPLFELDQQNRYLVVLDKEEPSLGDHGGRVRQLITPVRHRILVRLWAQLVFPVLFRRERVDVVHFAKNLGTFFTPGRSVITMYDMTYLAHPEYFPRGDVWYWRAVQPAILGKVDRIIAISENTANDLVRFYGLSRGKIVVIPCTCHPRYRPLTEEQVRHVRARYRLPDRMILHVGSISPKKNLRSLLEAFAMVVEEDGYEGALVLVGRVYEQCRGEAVYGQVEKLGLGDRVIFTGSVPDEDLPALYNAAEFIVFPSVHEGFGIVPLEAMSSGLPVIASSLTALPEVVGEAGVLLSDPTDPLEIKSAILDLLRDGDLREELRMKGLRRAERFSPRAAAQRTLQMYEELGSVG